MRFAYKLKKLAEPLTYRRAWRRAERVIYPLPPAPILARIDQRRLAQIQERYALSTHHYSKYADVKRWLRHNIKRAQDLKLHRSSSRAVLDLGCGPGFFLFILQQLGHSCLGLDNEEFPLFQELLDLFQVRRQIWTIRAFNPLPRLENKFDLVTAFSTSFNFDTKRNCWWGPAEWAFFLSDLDQHLNPGGRLFVGLNPDKFGKYYTPELQEFFLSRGALIERENVTFPPKQKLNGDSIGASIAPAGISNPDSFEGTRL